MQRYVVQEHTWRGVHWDFMLEVGGTLRTWAIDTPLVPGIDLAARLLDDHRLDYLFQEGPVGGGRGRVDRWDRGTFEVLAWNENEVLVRLAGSRLACVAHLIKKLTGPMADEGDWMLRLTGKVD